MIVDLALFEVLFLTTISYCVVAESSIFGECESAGNTPATERERKMLRPFQVNEGRFLPLEQDLLPTARSVEGD